MIGTCEFCGQTVTADTAQTQEEADRYASTHCACSASYGARKREEQISAAKDNVKQLFGEDSLNIGFKNSIDADGIDFLCNLVELVAHAAFESAKIGMGIYGTATVSITAKDEIRVQRAQGHSIKTEV